MENFTDDFGVSPRKRIPLWLFIIELLDLDADQNCLCWTYEQPYEFMVRNPDELAALWGSLKQNPTMTYSKLTRGLRYYYGKNIIEKVRDRPFTYRFTKSRKTERYLKRFKFSGKISKFPVDKLDIKRDTSLPNSPQNALDNKEMMVPSPLSENEFVVDFGKTDINLYTSIPISALQTLNFSETMPSSSFSDSNFSVDFDILDEILRML